MADKACRGAESASERIQKEQTMKTKVETLTAIELEEHTLRDLTWGSMDDDRMAIEEKPHTSSYSLDEKDSLEYINDWLKTQGYSLKSVSEERILELLSEISNTKIRVFIDIDSACKQGHLRVYYLT